MPGQLYLPFVSNVVMRPCVKDTSNCTTPLDSLQKPAG